MPNGTSSRVSRSTPVDRAPVLWVVRPRSMNTWSKTCARYAACRWYGQLCSSSTGTPRSWVARRKAVNRNGSHSSRSRSLSPYPTWNCSGSPRSIGGVCEPAADGPVHEPRRVHPGERAAELVGRGLGGRQLQPDPVRRDALRSDRSRELGTRGAASSTSPGKSAPPAASTCSASRLEPHHLVRRTPAQRRELARLCQVGGPSPVSTRSVPIPAAAISRRLTSGPPSSVRRAR